MSILAEQSEIPLLILFDSGVPTKQQRHRILSRFIFYQLR